jgi:formate/nitrite transporter|uniref:Formate/nitrite transporter family protein n=1 Tax=Thermomicrobium roseum TaxID=500 RepID=A0A7C2BE34_THERO
MREQATVQGEAVARLATDAVSPYDLVAAALEASEQKARLAVAPMVVRGALSGALLAAATLLAVTAWAQGLPRIVGAMIFPVGFCVLVLLGLELATGNFALLPAGWYVGRVDAGAVGRNWWWVYLGNLVGGAGFAVLAVASLTGWWSHDAGAVGEQLRQLALSKTVAYAEAEWRGWLTAFTKAVLANWLVTIGTMLGFSSRSTVGKVVAMWLPIMTFFGLGYEHSVVNMFVIPAGMLAGAPLSLGTWWVWNQVPATLGNIVGGGLFTGIALAWSYSRRSV